MDVGVWVHAYVQALFALKYPRDNDSEIAMREGTRLLVCHAVREAALAKLTASVFFGRQLQVDHVLMDAGRATGVTATVTPRGGGKVIPPPNTSNARVPWS